MFLGVCFLKMSGIVKKNFKFNVCICIFIKVQRIQKFKKWYVFIFFKSFKY